MERIDLKKRIDKMQEKKNKKLAKEQGNVEEYEQSSEGEDAEGDRVKEKKAKNMAKMMKYHQRKRRDFKQREPVGMKQQRV